MARADIGTDPLGGQFHDDVAGPGISPQLQAIIDRFSTTDVADPERVARWEAKISTHLYALTARTLQGEAFAATVSSIHLPRTVVAHVSAESHLIERTSKHIDSSPANAVVMNFSMEGEAGVYFDDGVRLLHPGNVMVQDLDRPFVRSFSKGLKELVFMIPKDAFDEIVGEDTRLADGIDVFTFGRDFKGNSYATSLAELFVGLLADPTSHSLAEVEDTAFDLLRAMYSQVANVGLSGQTRTVMAYIDRNLRNPLLGAALIAEELKMSERQLSRVVGASGVNLATLIRDKRLNLARRVLLNSNTAFMSLQDVASYCGFASHAHFTRVFKEKFGVNPSESRFGTKAG